MKRILGVLGMIMIMGLASYGCMKVLLHYASKPAGVSTMPKVDDVKEKSMYYNLSVQLMKTIMIF